MEWREWNIHVENIVMQEVLCVYSVKLYLLQMNRVQPENVHSTIFTPREYQVELVDACLRQNTLTVLASRSTRTFLITMVTRELAHLTRR